MTCPKIAVRASSSVVLSMLRLRVLPGRHAQKSSGVEVGVYKVEYDAHAMDSPCDKTSTFNLINLATDVFPILGLSSSEVDGP